MAGIANNSTQKPPNWFIHTCKWLWQRQKAILAIMGISGIVGSVIATFLFLKWPWASNKNLHGTFVGWCFQNWYLLLFIGLFLLLIDAIIYLGSRFEIAVAVQPMPPVPARTPEELLAEQQLKQEEEAKRRYLQRIIRETEDLMPKGYSTISSSVPLDKVFIPLQFKPGRPPSDKPVSEEERRLYRDFFQRYAHLYSQETSKELEEALYQPEHTWERILMKRDRIDITDLWRDCTHNEPAAVIQGYPGMGKSTLMQRLALHMARRNLNVPDPEMTDSLHLQPTLIPILIPLKEYADAQEQNAALTLEKHLANSLDTLNIPGAASSILSHLKAGQCLIMLDGLDEVGNPATRKRVQEDIRIFINNNADVSAATFNHFFITSRVAGYDQAAFPDYPHYVIADLNPEQINNFLPRWCFASIRSLRIPSDNQQMQPEEHEAIKREADHLAGQLREAIAQHQGVREMAENPFLLTLLAIMQQNTGVLPDRRIELYTVVTNILLENRNVAKNLDPIPENRAVQYLGPLAFAMQEHGNSFARKRDVVASLQDTICPAEKARDRWRKSRH